MTRIVLANLSPADIQVGDIATRPLVTVPVDMSLFACSSKMMAAGIRRLVVEHNGEPIGIVSDTDLFRIVDEFGWTQLRAAGDHCVFLDEATMHCRVYRARPIQCRTFPFWRDNVVDGEWTPEVRAHCEGVGRGRLWSVVEVESRMIEMEASEEE